MHMATQWQRAAAPRNIKKAARAARQQRTVAHLPKKTRTALGKEGAKVAKRNRAAHRSSARSAASNSTEGQLPLRSLPSPTATSLQWLFLCEQRARGAAAGFPSGSKNGEHRRPPLLRCEIRVDQGFSLVIYSYDDVKFRLSGVS
jgi:hypothetical protein